MTRGETAEKFFREGYNCAQSVVLAFSDILPYSREELAKLSSPMGGGMGRMREVCGAVSGMALVEGLLHGYCDPKSDTAKAALYARVQKNSEDFRIMNGSIVCRELLGIPSGKSSSTPTPRTDEFYKKRPCALLVNDAASILERNLKS